jgi:cellulose biosynthesis protein BcsE
MKLKLNINGLPDNCQYIKRKGLYAFMMNNNDWHSYLLASITCQSLVFLSYKSADVSYQQLTLPERERETESVALYTFSTLPKKNKPYDAKKLCLELTRLKINNSIICIDFTELLFFSYDECQAEKNLNTLKEWAQSSENTLFLFFNTSDNEAKSALFLHEHQTAFTGLVTITGNISPQQWKIDHWFGLQSLVANQQFQIHTQNNRWSVSTNHAPAVQNLPQTELRDHPSTVYVDQYASEFSDELNKDWHICSNQTELLEKAEKDQYATLIIHVYLSTNLKQLAHFVLTLRQRCGRYLKVIIREVNTQLRLTEQNLLRRLGANIVISANLPIFTVNNIIDAIRNSYFSDEINDDFESTYQRAHIVQTKGYLPATQFVEQCRQLINTSALYDIKISLVELVCSAGLAPLDTVKFCQCQRNGDVFTLTDHAVYFFLYGCREEYLNATLSHILGVNSGTIFKAQTDYLTIESAQIQLNKLEKYISQHTVTDYSNELQAIADNNELATQIEENDTPKSQKHVTPLAKPINLPFKELSL